MTTSSVDAHAEDTACGFVSQQTATRVNVKAIVVFIVIAFSFLLLVEIPVYLTGGIAPGGRPNPLFTPLTLVGMFAPAIAAVIVTLTIQRPEHPGRFLGLVPLRPWGRTVRYSIIGFLGSWLVGLGAIGLAALLGVVHLKLSPNAPGTLLIIPLASFLTAFAAFGEELGWRGFLLPALRPLGTWPALVLHGVIWGLWHAPVILIGYNYGTTNPVGVVLMTVSTVLIGFLFGWLRMRSASVYPSSFAHGALNGSSGGFLTAFLPTAVGGGAIAASPLGWAGWIILAIITLALFIARSYIWAPQAAPGVHAGSARTESAQVV